jgi:hypothetical protein
LKSKQDGQQNGPVCVDQTIYRGDPAPREYVYLLLLETQNLAEELSPASVCETPTLPFKRHHFGVPMRLSYEQGLRYADDSSHQAHFTGYDCTAIW